MVCHIGRLLDHLILNILTPHLIRLTKKYKCSDHCYANGPKVMIAVSPNDMPLSIQRTDIIGRATFYFGHLHNNSHCMYICWSV